MKGAALALAALILLPGCATLSEDGDREIQVEAEGWTPADRADVVSTERRALADAQRRAVEKAIGVTVRASTKVDDAIDVRQSIVANLGGTIRRYRVLSAGLDGDVYKVRIQAVVLYHPQAPSPKALKATRFAVKLANEKVAAAIRGVLASYDYQVAEEESAADVVVTGVVETYGRADLRLGGFYSYRASLNLSVVDVRTGKVLDQTQEASAVDVDERTACDMALEEAGHDAALALVSRYDQSQATQAASR